VNPAAYVAPQFTIPLAAVAPQIPAFARTFARKSVWFEPMMAIRFGLFVSAETTAASKLAFALWMLT
jgi:hypothetical protein